MYIALQLAPGLSCLFLPAFSAFSAFLLTSFLSLKWCQFHHVQLQNPQRTSVCGKLVSMSSSVSSASSASVRFLSCRCSQMSALHTLMHAACHTPLQLFSFFLLGELCNALSSAPVKQLKCVIACRQQKLAVCFLFPVFLINNCIRCLCMVHCASHLRPSLPASLLVSSQFQRCACFAKPPVKPCQSKGWERVLVRFSSLQMPLHSFKYFRCLDVTQGANWKRMRDRETARRSKLRTL